MANGTALANDNEGSLKYMLMFLCGVIVGGMSGVTLGVVLMCMLQINRINKDKTEGCNEETKRTDFISTKP